MLLGAVILTTNKGIYESSGVMLTTNFALESTALAASTIDEAEALPFDESTRFGVDSLTSQLTPVGSLGQENVTGDTLNDFDDYNGLVGSGGRLATDSSGTGLYRIRTRVYYVTINNLSAPAATPTWFKRIDVTVWNTVDSTSRITMSSVYSYYYFR